MEQTQEHTTHIQPRTRYGFTIWSPIVSTTNITKPQALQNTTHCNWLHINIQHLNDKINKLPRHIHLNFHDSQIRQKPQHLTHPLHSLTIHTTPDERNKLHSTTTNTTTHKNVTLAHIEQN